MSLPLFALMAAAQFGGQVGSTFDSIIPLVLFAILIFVLWVVWNIILAVFQWLVRALKTVFK